MFLACRLQSGSRRNFLLCSGTLETQPSPPSRELQRASACVTCEIRGYLENAPSPVVLRNTMASYFRSFSSLNQVKSSVNSNLMLQLADRDSIASMAIGMESCRYPPVAVYISTFATPRAADCAKVNDIVRLNTRNRRREVPPR